MSKINVVVVEDESIVSKDIQNSLKKIGYNVVGAAATADAAIALIEEFKPDVVLMDIMIKGDKSGIDVAEYVRENHSIPVIFLTAYADNATFNKAKNTEPYGYIIKPFKEIDLQTSIELALFKHEKNTTVIKERDLLTRLVESKQDSNIFFIKANSSLHKVYSKDIIYVEALKDYVMIHTRTQGRFTIHNTMKEVNNKLSSGEFIRIHRSFIVRLENVIAVDYFNLTLDFETKVLPIGASYRDNFYEHINQL
ncbi:MAG: response regulator [Bacteroidia bacterium]|jgi:two-component system, LytTR family, response regulator LytT